MKKKILAGILAGAVVFSMTACSSTSDSSDGSSSDTSQASDGDITIGMVLKTATNAHFQDIAYGATLAAEELGINIKIDNTTTETDVEGQITKCEDLISSGVDALILTANDSSGVGSAVESAHSAGIPFVTADTEIVNDWGDDVSEYMPNFIGEDYQELAYQLSKQVCEALGGEGKVVILRGIDAASSSQQRTAGIEQAIEEYEGIEIVESKSANYDQDTATSTMSDILQAHPDIDAVICCNDMMAMGSVTALKENNIELGGEDGVLVAGLDGNIIALDSIEAGDMYATLYDWSMLQGYYSVMQAYDLIEGKEVPEETLTVGTVITSENVADFIPHGEIVSDWSFGSSIGEVPSEITDFMEYGRSLNE
ncbi:sugar ABC transporter substrate-binding protein [Eubacterium oxidoreducens]|uniref:Ribose transport system substrate-binding protein n=1 Tax=Eubacterium oxidoreducens TaxID=1732 RepID=A0A1G6AFY1_EUBOX|nr:sugar ABC transporter substrate-binding protein [Eubacterium oxidoreducens]SDB07186.1 ribose transport system substrate-binding protein [Eubacterium oxidoreducens]